jgi:DNA (cytosine-5)-methyltransferase 1
MFKVLDLFSGIGGFSLGLDRSGGFRTVAFCEIEEFPRRILAQHWPEVLIYDDIRSLTATRLAADGIIPDVICGGFPCQDISLAGPGLGLDGERSGLWREFFRLIREIRPEYAILENVAALLSRGLGRVLADLASIGYDAEWHCIPASHVGAEHDRDRVWIIAYHDQTRELQLQGCEQDQRRRTGDSVAANVAHTDQARYAGRLHAGTDGAYVGKFAPWLRSAIDTAPPFSHEHWDYQPILGRGLHGVPNRVDRIGSLGNAVVPLIPEIIGRAILAAEGR